MSSMPFDETNIGDPFYGDFPNLPAGGPWADLAATVQRQVRELQQLRFEPDVRHAFLELLMQRRESAGRVRDPVVTAFDFLPVDVGFDLLLVPGELLLARPAPTGSRIEIPGVSSTTSAWIPAKWTATSYAAGCCG